MNPLERLRKLEHELADSRAHAKRLEAAIHAQELAAQHVHHSAPLPLYGVDYSFARPRPGQLRAAGVRFAVRYLTGPGKALTRLEAENLSGAGISVVACHETGGRTVGYQLGATQAREAAAAAKHLGVPAGRPIYFACDFDAAGAGVTGEVMEYLRGAGDAIGHHRVGLYAGLAVIERAAALHRAPYLWQTLAWSGGRWSPHAQLRQRAIERIVAGARVDLDEARAADFGQWRL